MRGTGGSGWIPRFKVLRDSILEPEGFAEAKRIAAEAMLNAETVKGHL